MLVLLGLLLLLRPLPAPGELLRVQAPGDVVIGGLFPLHLRPDSTFPSPPLRNTSCSNYDMQVFLRAQMMIFAIDEVNRRTPRALPGVTLGYDIYDTCGDVSLAMRAALDMSANASMDCFSSADGDPSSAPSAPRVKAVIGARASEVSAAVARVLALSCIPQISYASTSQILSRNDKFPTFLRTVASDACQTKAMAALVDQFKWKTVGVVGSDDEYGKYGSESLVDCLSLDRVCLDFKVILPGEFDLNNTCTRKKLDWLMDTIQNSTAEAVVLFTKESNVMLVLQAAIRRNLSRTWIASDSWSNSSLITELPGIEGIGSVFGFNFKNHVVEGFKNYIVSSVRGNSSKLNAFWEYHLSQYPRCQQNTTGCSLAAHKCMDPKCLGRYIEWNGAFNVYLAVKVITHALGVLMECDGQQCQRNASFTAYELFNEIKNISLTVDNHTNITFDRNGDPTLGYDIIKWNLTKLEIIGEYGPSGKIDLPQHLLEKMGNVTVTAFGCHKKCSPGFELFQQGSDCCKKCVPCGEGHFSPKGGVLCQKCEDSEYSAPQKDRCWAKTNEFPKWESPLIITLCFFDILGIVATVFVVVIFVLNQRTPIVKAIGGYLCFLELFSLLACFLLNFAFMSKPTKASCMAGMPLFGMAFTLCVSCILANLLQILVGFNFAQNKGGWLKRLNHPPVVVTILFGVQLVLCSIWLAWYPPYPQSIRSVVTIRLVCNPGSKVLFGAMLGYVGLLAVVCFLFAFDGKRLPDLYKNASCVTIGMLLFLVVWIVFIPITMKRLGYNMCVINAAAVLVSSYSMLSCHLVPKCYIILFRRELNDERAITDYIKKHYEQKGITVLKS